MTVLACYMCCLFESEGTSGFALFRFTMVLLRCFLTESFWFSRLIPIYDDPT